MREHWSSSTGLANARRTRLIIALMVLFVLWWVLLGKLEREIQRAEEQSVNMVLSQLRSALVIKGSEAMLGRDTTLTELEGQNPFGWLEHRWQAYTGLCSATGPEPGQWCFTVKQQKETGERAQGWLIYNPKQPITINGNAVDASQPVAWVVTTEFADRNRNNLREHNERLTGLKLEPVPITETTVNRQDARHE